MHMEAAKKGTEAMALNVPPPGLNDWGTHPGSSRAEPGLYPHSPPRLCCVLLHLPEAQHEGPSREPILLAVVAQLFWNRVTT